MGDFSFYVLVPVRRKLVIGVKQQIVEGKSEKPGSGQGSGSFGDERHFVRSAFFKGIFGDHRLRERELSISGVIAVDAARLRGNEGDEKGKRGLSETAFAEQNENDADGKRSALPFDPMAAARQTRRPASRGRDGPSKSRHKKKVAPREKRMTKASLVA